MPAPKPIRARSFMWAHDYVKAMFNSLNGGATVTRFVIEAEKGEAAIEFELRVTKVGDKRLPRVVTPAAASGSER